MALKGGFPDPVNETSARLVAFGVVVMGVAFLATREGWVLLPLLYGFVARVLAGPRFSVLGRLVTDVITPRLPIEGRPVGGRPKRFAQGVGVLFTTTAALAWLLGAPTVAVVSITVLVACAGLESGLGLCLGCVVYGRLIRWGLLPAEACAECADISGRLRAAAIDHR